MCRTLGIACRSVTNYSSAHDHDESLTIDTFYDENMEKIEYMANDSVWFVNLKHILLDQYNNNASPL